MGSHLNGVRRITVKFKLEASNMDGYKITLEFVAIQLDEIQEYFNQFLKGAGYYPKEGGEE